MRKRATIAAVVVVILFVALALLPPENNGRRKARPQRISSVNSVRSLTLILTNTNALSSAQAVSGK